jgi:hypothetical protein
MHLFIRKVKATGNSQHQQIFRPYAPDIVHLIRQSVVANEGANAFPRGI